MKAIPVLLVFLFALPCQAEGTWQLIGEEPDVGHRVDVRVEITRTRAAGVYRVQRVARCSEERRVFWGLGRLRGASASRVLEVRFHEGGLAGALAQQPQRARARYAASHGRLEGEFQGPMCAAETFASSETGQGRMQEAGRRDPSTIPPRPKPSVKELRERQLRAFLERAVRVAWVELMRGVREDRRLGRDRGKRIDEYARLAGMPTGLPWCGFFVGFSYTQAARQLERSFAGRRRLHSVTKCRSYFLYGVYPGRKDSKKRRAALARLRNAHADQGPARRYYALRGSSGARYAARRKLAGEVYGRWQDLPIQPGDTILWRRHIGLVVAYDWAKGKLVTIEGNWSSRVARRTYDLTKARVRGRIDSFGRPALADFRR